MDETTERLREILEQTILETYLGYGFRRCPGCGERIPEDWVCCEDCADETS